MFNELFLVRLFAYSLSPLLLAMAHNLLDKNTQTTARRIEVFMVYILAISVGANGLGGAFGHLFLSDIVAESIGWDAGSPFQLEMGFANLTIGILGLMAIGRRDGFRTATIIATSVIGFGATGVHLMDIVAHGNLSAGNTIQNVANLLDPILLISLTYIASRTISTDNETAAYYRWHSHLQMIAGLTAAGIGMGFGMGFALDSLLPITLIGGLGGMLIGVWASLRHERFLLGSTLVSGEQ